MTTERGLLEQAIETFQNHTGLRLNINQFEPEIDGRKVDAALQLEGHQETLVTQIKKWAQHTNIGVLIHQLRGLPGRGLLVADFVNPNQAERLKQEKIQFIDTAGNAYIDLPPVFIYITGKRIQHPARYEKEGAKRAFEPAGLKVVFAFLCNPGLINAPYREIVEKTGVAQGTVGWVMHALKEGTFIQDMGRAKGRRLRNYRKLLDRWVENWPERLRPKLLQGHFTAETPNWWKNFDIQKYHGCWGGEIAAANYTGYLKPKITTIYLPEQEKVNLLRNARLKKITDQPESVENEIIVYKQFWPEKLVEMLPHLKEGMVPPVLAYADLVATGDPRNLETATKIYEDYLAQFDRED